MPRNPASPNRGDYPDSQINLSAGHGTRMSRRPDGTVLRRLFNGRIRGPLAFDHVIEHTEHDSSVIHEAVKGIFVENSALIRASAQQMAIEVAVQLTGLKRLAAVGGTSLAGARAILETVAQNMPLYGIANALSRMKQHDRDLATDERTKSEIKNWRKTHKPTGSPRARIETLVSSLWTNAANTAIDHVNAANKLRADHPRDLGHAPVLKVCEEDPKHPCRGIDHDMVTALFPMVK